MMFGAFSILVIGKLFVFPECLYDMISLEISTFLCFSFICFQLFVYMAIATLTPAIMQRCTQTLGPGLTMAHTHMLQDRSCLRAHFKLKTSKK